MAIPKNPESDIQQLVKDGNAVFVVGTGVSIGATWDPATKSSHPQASWAGLLRHGLQWLEEHDLLDEEIRKGHLAILSKSPKTRHFITIAEDITEQMGGSSSIHYSNWLEATIGKITAKNRDTLDALHAIRKNANLLATTNYDNLLLEGNSKLRPVTWMEGDELIRALRERNTDQILFLHGHWRKPQSVILDWNSYDRISRDERHRDDLKTLWASKPWIYVGCGVDGLDDPDLGLLLERYGKRYQAAGLWDYCLCLDGEREKFQSHFEEKGYNICAVSYGIGFEDLPGFLNSLLPMPVGSAQQIAPPYQTPKPNKHFGIPQPPELYAVPSYIGSHEFIGRRAQLNELDEWALASDPTQVLLCEAIGGSGKSLLTWHWLNHRAQQVREDWAGRIWYSFYEGGAVMADFCRHALAYMQGVDMEELKKAKGPELKGRLLRELNSNPWLVVLDGLERILVAYHRIDAPSLRDEEVDTTTDQIADRNICDTVRPEDGIFLRQLAAAAPSKVLVSTRLTPAVMLNPSNQAIPGTKRLQLPGLRRDDAEEMFRRCGVNGDLKAIQDYLSTNCDNHPLVIGILAGLVVNYLPNPSNFDAWVIDANLGGGSFNLGGLDLVQRKNHILGAAMRGITPKDRELLSVMSLLPNGANFETLGHLNPHLPPKPEIVDEPVNPEFDLLWDFEERKEQQRLKRTYRSIKFQYEKYLKERNLWESPKVQQEAVKSLIASLNNLQRRGLVQFDPSSKRHNLHPVVRSVAKSYLDKSENHRLGSFVVDHFNSLAQDSCLQATLVSDLENRITVVKILQQMGEWKSAADALLNDLVFVLIFKFEAYDEAISLLRPFFNSAWDTYRIDLSSWQILNLLLASGLSLLFLGEMDYALMTFEQLIKHGLLVESTDIIVWGITFATTCLPQGEVPNAIRLLELANSLAQDEASIFLVKSHLFLRNSLIGRGDTEDQKAQIPSDLIKRLESTLGSEMEEVLNNFRGNETDSVGTPSAIESISGMYETTGKFLHGNESIENFKKLLEHAQGTGLRVNIRSSHAIASHFLLHSHNLQESSKAAIEAIRMAREAGFNDEYSELSLFYSQLLQGEATDVEEQIARFESLPTSDDYLMARIFQQVANDVKAKRFALEAYKLAWGAGEPYVHRYYLDRAAALLHELGEPLPILPPYDPAKDRVFPWEKDVQALIERLDAKKQNTKEEPSEPF